MCIAPTENSFKFLKILSMQPSNCTPVEFISEMKHTRTRALAHTHTHTRTHTHITVTQMFIAALFVTAQTGKQSKCPSVCNPAVGEWFNIQ